MGLFDILGGKKEAKAKPVPEPPIALLIRAISDNDTIAFKGLLGKIADLSEKISINGKQVMPPLCYAASVGRTKFIGPLLSAGSNPNVPDNDGITALMYAAGTAYDVAEVKELLKAGADANAMDLYQNSVIKHAVVFSKNPEIVRELVKAKADVNIPNKYGQTPLMDCALNGMAAVARLLLDAGAKVNAQDEDGKSALQFASANGHAEIVSLLLKTKANANISDNLKFTPIIDATYQGHADIVRMLIKAGADVNRKNVDGTSVMQYAKICRQESKRTMLQRLLKEAGAKDAVAPKMSQLDEQLRESQKSLNKNVNEATLKQLKNGEISKKQQDDYLRYLDQMLERQPTHFIYKGNKSMEESLIRGIALNASILQDYEKAIRLSREGLRINPKSAYLYYMKGRSEGDAGKYPEGIKDLDMAIKLEPNFADAYVERGVIRRKMGMSAQANDDFRRAKEIEPSIKIP